MVRPLRIEYERRGLSYHLAGQRTKGQKGKKGTDLFIENRQAVFVADEDYPHNLENLRDKRTPMVRQVRIFSF